MRERFERIIERGLASGYQSSGARGSGCVVGTGSARNSRRWAVVSKKPVKFYVCHHRAHAATSHFCLSFALYTRHSIALHQLYLHCNTSRTGDTLCVFSANTSIPTPTHQAFLCITGVVDAPSTNIVRCLRVAMCASLACAMCVERACNSICARKALSI